MPADPITPSLGAAWSNTPPSQTPGIQLRLYALARQASNLSIPGSGAGGCPAVFDGVSIAGPLATVSDRLVLLHAQSAAAQNGLYRPVEDDAGVTLPSNYDSITGLATKTGLTVGKLYSFRVGTGQTVTNGTITLSEDGFIEPSGGGSLTFSGPNGGTVTSVLWQTYMGRDASLDNPAEATAGSIVIVRGGASGPSLWSLRSNVATIGSSAMNFDQVTVSNFTPSNAGAFDNSNAGSNTPGNSAAWDNTNPDASTTPLQNAPIANTGDNADGSTPGLGTNWDNTPPTALVLQGETSPVAGITTPASPSSVDHTATLVAGTNYLVQVGTRLAPVTVTLPNPGSLAQRIEIADISGQAATYPITVNAGTRDIETAGQTSYVINRNDAVLAISYTGSKWKIL